MVEKPARRYETRAWWDGHGFVAEFTIPGMTPFGVDGDFDSEVEALAKAGRLLCAAMNKRTTSKTKFGYQRMGGAELAVALKNLQITPTEFGILYGTTLDRVMSWIDGAEDVPHPVRILLAAFAFPGVLNVARQLTSTVTRDRRDKDE